MRFLPFVFVAAGVFLSGRALTVVDIPKTGAPNIVDGILTDGCWTKAYRTGAFVPLKAGSALKYPTEAMLCRDAENLYIAFVCKAESGAAIERESVRQAKRPWGLDHIEVFVDPGDSGSTQQLGLDVGGTLSFKGFGSDVKYGIQYVGNAWQCEIRLPFAAIPVGRGPYKPNWALNLARDNAANGELATWAPLARGSFHDPEGFRHVHLGNVDLAKIRAEQERAGRGDFAITTDRIVYSSEREMKVRLDVEWRKSMKGFRIAARLADTNGVTAVARDVSPVFFTTEFTLPLDGVANGRYRLELAVKDRNGGILKEGVSDVWKIPPIDPAKRRTKWEIRNQRFYRNGKLFLPIFTWYGGFDERDYADMQRHGINMLCFGDTSFVDENYAQLTNLSVRANWARGYLRRYQAAGHTFSELMGLLAKYDMDAMPLPPYLGKLSPAHIDAFVRCLMRTRDCDRIAFWHTADETDAQIRENALRHRLCREIDPTRYTFLNVILALGENKDNCDILGSDPYPCYYDKTDLNRVTARCDNLVRSANRSEQSHLLWIQIFGDGTPNKGWRPATPAEARAQAYLAMNHGAKGIGWWVYAPPEKRTPYRQIPESWEELGKVHAELQSLKEVFLLGEKVCGGLQGQLDVSAYRWNGKTYVSLVNVPDKPAADAAVRVPGFPERKISLKGYEQKVEVW